MGIRTPGLVIANDALYQLSYTPDFAGVMLTALNSFSRAARFPATRPAANIRHYIYVMWDKKF
jgi:hypothetical protein